jgi:hypothetical protein
VPITVSCSNCGTTGQVASEAAGKRAQCRACGAVVQIPATRPKVCSTCGRDVSHATRVKDERGNYYCDPCSTKLPPGQHEQGDPLRALADALHEPPGERREPPQPAGVEVDARGNIVVAGTATAVRSALLRVLQQSNVTVYDHDETGLYCRYGTTQCRIGVRERSPGRVSIITGDRAMQRLVIDAYTRTGSSRPPLRGRGTTARPVAGLKLVGVACALLIFAWAMIDGARERSNAQPVDETHAAALARQALTHGTWLPRGFTVSDEEPKTSFSSGTLLEAKGYVVSLAARGEADGGRPIRS